MAFTVVIPARYQSSRFPGKPLVDIKGKPMIQHVVERAQEAGASAVIVATDDNRIASVAGEFAEVVMTDTAHTSGTERIAEVVRTKGETRVRQRSEKKNETVDNFPKTGFEVFCASLWIVCCPLPRDRRAPTAKDRKSKAKPLAPTLPQ